MIAKRVGGESGAVLLEVIVALAIVTAVGVGAVSLTSQSLRSVELALEREAEVQEAGRLLAAVWLWPRADLDRHLGESVQGPYRLRVQRLERRIYTVEIAYPGARGSLLRTVLFRGRDE
jgi:hypothetical protein